MNWFKKLTGFAESSPDEVRRRLVVEGPYLRSTVNGRRWHHGTLSTPDLARLRTDVAAIATPNVPTTVSEIVADVRQLHREPRAAGAVFQAASQFNLLEMVNPHVTPEDGVARYEYDRTQGPACAIACGGGTIYRNYFAPVNGQTGQSADHQIDCLAGLGAHFNNAERHIWTMRNGYALASADGLTYLNEQLAGCTATELDRLRGLLSVGVHADTEVTLSDNGQRVTQVYCSALPVGYSPVAAEQWEPFARLVLTATYEATLAVAALNRDRTGNNVCYLTLVGGGVFANEPAWLVDSVLFALDRYRLAGLRVVFVSYGGASSVVKEILGRHGG